MTKKHSEILLFGKVYGIGLSFRIMKTADELGIFGTVRYLSENELIIEAEGIKQSIEALVNWCSTIPEVENTEIIKSEIGLIDYKDFKIVE